MYRIFSIFFVLLLPYPALAQFKGVDSFRWDTVWQTTIRLANVKSVTETGSYLGGKEYDLGYYVFNKKGLLAESTNPDDGGHKRHAYTYNKKSQLIKFVNYTIKDTTKIDYWEDYEFDKSGKEIKSIKNSLNYGKLIQDIAETKILSKTKNITVKEIIYNKAGKIYLTVYERDSLDGIYTFITRTEKTEEPVEDTVDKTSNFISQTKTTEDPVEVSIAKGPEIRIMTRSYSLNAIHFSDEIVLEIYDQEETVKAIKTSYVKHDAKKRVVEIGKIKYGALFGPYLGGSYYKLSKEESKKVLDGTITGKEEIVITYTYKDDLLIEEAIAGTKKQYSYNQKCQLIKCVNLKSNEILRYEYNDKGLITEITTTNSLDEKQTTIKTVKYTYDYY